MSASPEGAAGLHTDQAPPLSIPASFFLLAPVAMLAAGLMMAFHGAAITATRWLPITMAATHIGTLGFLGSIMLGALYQMIPVVAGAPVPAPRLAHVVHAALALGVSSLAVGFTNGRVRMLALGAALLALALVLFLAAAAIALARAPTRDDTVTGMRLAVAGLFAVALLGVLMALGRSGYFPVRGSWLGWVTAHAATGALVWVGGLIASVSWQVVPMFYLTAPLPPWSRHATLTAVALALFVGPLAAVYGAGPVPIALAAAPAAVMVWIVHPIVTARALHLRKRRRVDGSVRFWWAGLVCAPLAIPLSLASALADAQRWPVTLGFLVVWGWAGLVAHGMLSRIVPFLVWFHRFSPLAGLVPVPSMRALLPDVRIRAALALHASAVVAGTLAAATGWSKLVRLAGLLLALAAVTLGANLVHALRQRPPRVEV